jgi:chromate transporter
MWLLAIIVSICYELGKETITDWRTILIAILSVGIVLQEGK